MFQWSKEYEVGEDRIDRQHQTLFRTVGDFIEDLYRDRFDPQLAVNILGMYARMHFWYEEECMTRLGCPAADRNRSEHEAFMAALREKEREIKASRGQDQKLVSQNLLEWIVEWLKRHVTGTDQQLGKYLPSRPAE